MDIARLLALFTTPFSSLQRLNAIDLTLPQRIYRTNISTATTHNKTLMVEDTNWSQLMVQVLVQNADLAIGDSTTTRTPLGLLPGAY